MKLIKVKKEDAIDPKKKNQLKSLIEMAKKFLSDVYISSEEDLDKMIKEAMKIKETALKFNKKYSSGTRVK